MPGDLPGDLDDIPVDAELVLKPGWDDGTACSVGVWAVETRGGGESAKGKDGKGSSQGGTFGVLTANWGGKWTDDNLHAHMQRDLKSSSCQFLVIQEASVDLLEYVQQDPGLQYLLREDGAQRPPARFIGVRGPEEGDSLMICGRESLVSGMRLLVFHRTRDGSYTVTNKRTKVKTTKIAVSRIMVASAKMRFWRPRGSGEADSDPQDFDEVRLANVHLHCLTAKKELDGGGRAYKTFWDVLARYLAEFRPRILCGDFNMALFLVVPELRARGFQINMAAWYPWKQEHETGNRADSCGIFRLGPCEGIRMCYGISAFGFEEPDLPANCSMMMETLRDQDGKETGKRPYPITNIPFIGQGYPLSSYHPKNARKDTCLRWSFTPVFDQDSPAVAEVLHCANHDKGMFPFPVNTTTGSASWSWSGTPPSKQKPVQIQQFDPQQVMFRGGAHMPMMIFVGASADVRRSNKAQKERAAKADKRGWTYERRMSTIPGGKGGKGKEHGQQKGAGAYDRGGGEPRDNRGKGEEGGARDQRQRGKGGKWW